MEVVVVVHLSLIVFTLTVLTPLTSRWLGTGLVVFLTPVPDRGLEDIWIMDSGCSRHMTGHRRWFSSLNPVSTKEYITFRDNGQGKVLGVSSVQLSSKLSLREVAFVMNLGFNLVSVLQLLKEGFEVRFKQGACCVLDAEETLVCSLLPFGQVFRVDLTSIFGPARCLVASPSADIWK